MRDITLEDTVYFDFTTRAFATGVPTVLAGSPVLSVLEENNVTPITAGVSVAVDRASVVGLNMATVAALAANGYENGKGYSVYISTGTVGGVSVVGEIVARFTVGASAAAVDLANGTDGLTALKADTAATLVDTAAMQPLVAKIPLSDGVITWNATALASINAEADTALTDYDPPTRTEATSDKDEIITDLDDIKGTGFVKDTHSLIDIEAYVDILDDGTSGNAKIATDVAAVLVDTGTTLDTKINDIQGATFATGTDSLEAIRNRGDAAWVTGGGGANPFLLQSTTIATLASQTSFTLTAGSPDNDSYIGAIAVITDVATSTQKAIGIISDYVGGSLTVTLREDPGIFTIAATDNIDIIASDLAGINIGLNGGNLSALNDLSVSETGDAVLDEVVEGAETLRELARIWTAVLANISSGGGTTTHTFRDRADSKDRVIGTVDASGNRTAITTFDGS